MKNIVLLFSFIIYSTLGFAQSTVSYKAKVSGMSCNYCTNSVYKKLKSIPGITQINIELSSGMVTFDLPQNKALSKEQVLDKINKTGYTPLWVELSEKINDASINNDNISLGKDKKSLVTDRILVRGNCGMCKERIENAANKIKGLKSADWDNDKEILTVSFDPKKTSTAAIEKKMAMIGHDTANEKAPDAVYESLHACCKYDRVQKSAN